MSSSYPQPAHVSKLACTARLKTFLPTRNGEELFYFLPADIVTRMLNFGIPSPVDIQIDGADLLFGTFVMYGYDTAPQMGAKLAYSDSAAFNPAVPASVVGELDDLKAQFASGKLKIVPTRQDAPGGK
jgi:hypothetical protein